MLQQSPDPLVTNVEKATDKGRREVFFEHQIKHHIQRVASLLTRKFSDGLVSQRVIPLKRGHRNRDSIPIALKNHTGPDVREVIPKPITETRILKGLF